VDGHIVAVDVATTADFSRDILRQIVAPVLQRVEGNHLDRVAELSRQKVGYDGLYVGALGFPGDSMLAWTFHDQIDRLIGAIRHTLRKPAHCPFSM
jgi:hypothetical protein